MSALGYIQARAYTSRAMMPLENVAVTITDSNGKPIAMRLTDESGLIKPVAVQVPDFERSQQPESGEKPFTSVDLYAKLHLYEQIEAKNLQVFADTVTTQDLEMIPLSELHEQWNLTETFDTPPQNL